MQRQTKGPQNMTQHTPQNTGMLAERMMIGVYTCRSPFLTTEIELMRKMFQTEELISASIEKSTEDEELNTPTTRRSDLFWFQPHLMHKYNCNGIIQKLAAQLQEINDEVFGFDLAAFTPPQMTRYTAEQSGFFDWHTDIPSAAPNICRKLSYTVQLSDPSEYEGGELGFMFHDNKVKFLGDFKPEALKKGTLIVFPSYLIHTVTPVTKGARHSMVGWCEGPRFR